MLYLNMLRILFIFVRGDFKLYLKVFRREFEFWGYDEVGFFFV